MARRDRYGENAQGYASQGYGNVALPVEDSGTRTPTSNLQPGERSTNDRQANPSSSVLGGGTGYGGVSAPSVAMPTGVAGASAYDLARAQAEAARTPYSGSAAQYAKPEYAGTFDQQLADIYARIAGRGNFRYDLNADPLYQQYKDNYVQQGKAAMRDTMGRAAALTGGYGSSYGQAVGQQAYDAALQKLGDIVPELYDRAYGRYQDEGNRMLQMAGLIGDLRDTEYGRYRDAMSDYNTDRSYAMQQERQDYDRWAAERDYADTQEQRALQQQASNRAYLQTLLALGYTPTAQEVADAGMTPEQYQVIAAQYLPKGGGYGGGSAALGDKGQSEGTLTQQMMIDPELRQWLMEQYMGASGLSGSSSSR